jgi:hypothetical protein
VNYGLWRYKNNAFSNFKTIVSSINEDENEVIWLAPQKNGYQLNGIFLNCVQMMSGKLNILFFFFKETHQFTNDFGKSLCQEMGIFG